MAYSDTNRASVQPKGLGAAILINGLAIFGIVSITPQGQKLINFGPTIVDFIPEAKDPPPPPEIPDTPSDQPLARPQSSPDKGSATSTNPLAFPQPDEGLARPPIQPFADPEPAPLPHNPVLKGARPDPRYTAVLQPEYPPSMIRAEIEGAVSVRVLVGTDGRVKDVQVTNSADEAFSEATKRQALRKWRFLPATRDGEPYEAWRDMTVRFSMPD